MGFSPINIYKPSSYWGYLHGYGPPMAGHSFGMAESPGGTLRGDPDTETPTFDQVSWIDVTKTQDDSWVATALSLNILMPLLLKPLENMINSHLSRGRDLGIPYVISSSFYMVKKCFNVCFLILCRCCWSPHDIKMAQSTKKPGCFWAMV